MKMKDEVDGDALAVGYLGNLTTAERLAVFRVQGEIAVI